MYFLAKIVLAFFCVFMFTANISYAEEAMSREALEQLILDTVRNHPQVLLDILRNNSEAVLDIAQQGSNARRLNLLQKQWQKDLRTTKKIKVNDRPMLGNKNAKVTIAAFSDFSCHYCQTSKNVLDKILKEFGSDVNFVFKSIPLDEKGPSALATSWFLAIANQSEEKAWAFYNIMFANPEKLTADGENFIRKSAKDLNLNMAKLEKDLKNDKKIKSIMKEDHDDSEKLNVEGTPCFFVNNIVLRGAMPLEFFRVAVKMALKDVANTQN